jgi:hypothetical protein
MPSTSISIEAGEDAMHHLGRLRLLAVTFIAGAIISSTQASAAVDQMLRAFAVWHTDAKLMAGDGGTHVFEGKVDGPFYVDTEKGPVNSGSISCQAKLTIKDADKTQEGTGDCTITVKDGATTRANLTCHGIFQVGCSGKLKLIDGTGRFKGITGSGDVVIRSDFADLQSNGIADPSTLQSGLIYFPALHYRLP